MKKEKKLSSAISVDFWNGVKSFSKCFRSLFTDHEQIDIFLDFMVSKGCTFEQFSSVFSEDGEKKIDILLEELSEVFDNSDNIRQMAIAEQILKMFKLFDSATQKEDSTSK